MDASTGARVNRQDQGHDCMRIDIHIQAEKRDLPRIIDAFVALNKHANLDVAAQDAIEVEIIEHDARVEAAEPVEAIVYDEPAEPTVYKQAADAPKPSVTFDHAVTEEEVVAALRNYATEKGLPAATALLAEFGAKRVGDVPVERRAEFIGRTKVTA